MEVDQLILVQGYNAGWGTPYYHPYANHPSAHNMNYGYA